MLSDNALNDMPPIPPSLFIHCSGRTSLNVCVSLMKTAETSSERTLCGRKMSRR